MSDEIPYHCLYSKARLEEKLDNVVNSIDRLGPHDRDITPHELREQLVELTQVLQDVVSRLDR